MPRTIHVPLDESAEADLALLRNEGHNDSEAVRIALVEAAERRRRRSALRQEAETAASDPADLAEARRVREEMDALAASSSRPPPSHPSASATWSATAKSSKHKRRSLPLC